MWDAGDLAWFLRTASRDRLWPIDVFTSAKASRGRQPDGTITIEAPVNAGWVTASGLLATAGGPGCPLIVECFVRGRVTPFQMGWVQGCDVSYDASTGTVSILAEAIWSFHMRSKLVLESGAGALTEVTYTGKADNVARAIIRNNLIAGANTPPSYPALLREDIGGLTPAVEADTTSHPTTITYKIDEGKNLREILLDLGETFDLRYGWTINAGTITYTVAYPWRAKDSTFGAGKVGFHDGLGTLAAVKDAADYSTVRNVWVIKDGTSRAWTSDGTSQGLYGTLEDTKKISGVGATVLGYDAAKELKDKDPVRAVDVTPLEAQSVWEAVTDYAIGDQVSVVCQPIGLYGDWDIVAMEISEAAGTPPQTTVTLNSERRSYAKESWRRPGPRGGYGAGSRWWSITG